MKVRTMNKLCARPKESSLKPALRIALTLCVSLTEQQLED